MSYHTTRAHVVASLEEPQTYAARSRRRGVPLSTLYHQEHGRRPRKAKAEAQQYLTPLEERALDKYVKLMADLGTPLRIKYIRALAFCIARKRSTTKAVNPPGKNWVQGFQKRHSSLTSRKMKAMDWKRYKHNIYDKIIRWFEIIKEVLEDPTVLPENTYNMDETGVMLSMLNSIKVLVPKEDPRDYRGTIVKRKSITAIECISAEGRVLSPIIIWPATTLRDNWHTFETPGWHYTCSETGYTNSKISLEWLKLVFDPQTKERAKGKPRVLISDGFRSHETLEIQEFCFDNNILLCRIPSHSSHKLQPCDLTVFPSLKDAYREEADQLYRGGERTINNKHFVYMYAPAREKAFTRRNITSGWAASGLVPFNPDRVLRVTPKPPPLSQETDSRINEIQVDSSQKEILQTPVTPVSAEAFVSLYNQIEQNIHTEPGTSRLQKWVQKLANAGQSTFAECALLQDQNQLLRKLNNQAKIRRSTKSTILTRGEGKVMSFEDIIAARAARVEKDAIKGKGKRGRKRKSIALEAGEPDVEAEAEAEVMPALNKHGQKRKRAIEEPSVDEPETEAEPKMTPAAKKAINGKAKRGRKRKRAVQEAEEPEPGPEPEPEPERMLRAPWRAPVARML